MRLASGLLRCEVDEQKETNKCLACVYVMCFLRSAVAFHHLGGHANIRPCFHQLTTTYDSSRQLTTAYDSLRQLTTAYDSLRWLSTTHDCFRRLTTVYDNLRQLTTAYNGSRQLTTACDSLRRLTTAHVSLRQFTTAYDSVRQRMSAYAASLRRGVNNPEWHVPLHSLMEVSRLSYQAALIHEFVSYVYSVAI